MNDIERLNKLQIFYPDITVSEVTKTEFKPKDQVDRSFILYTLKMNPYYLKYKYQKLYTLLFKKNKPVKTT